MSFVPRWPRIVIRSGPDIAGLRAGDSLSIMPDDLLLMTTTRWNPQRLALSILPTRSPPVAGHAWRFHAKRSRFEYMDDLGGPEGDVWRSCRRVIELGASNGEQRWTLELVDDGPAITTVRQFGPNRCFNPAMIRHDSHAVSSSWLTVIADGTLRAIVVRERADGTQEWLWSAREPRPALVTPEDLPRLDDEIAAGIVSQMSEWHSLSFVDFDGVVHAVPGDVTRHSRDALWWTLTRGSEARTPSERTGARMLREGKRAATKQEVADVIRALFPDEWARERQLREEIAMLPS